MTQEDVRDAAMVSLSLVGGCFPYHVLAAVDSLDGQLTYEKWLSCSRILRSLVSLDGTSLGDEGREARMRAFYVASACEMMAKASFSGTERVARAIESAVELLSTQGT